MNLTRTTSDNPLFKELVLLLDQELDERYGEIQDGYDQYNEYSSPVDVIILTQEGKAIACGAIRQLEGYNWAEVKRVFVLPNFRGQGLSKKIVEELEKWAIEQEFEAAVLETGIRLHEAIALYKKIGYQEVAKFEPYKELPHSICMKKVLC